ncbi:MAG: LPS-assembly protein LptD [Gammaproteobacteria bacterium]|nr:MAG: LPS-assembly protein LptD [Gammaproteobacteria bacterium]
MHPYPTIISAALACACIAAGAAEPEVANRDWGGCRVEPPPLPVSGPGPASGELEILTGRAELTPGQGASFSDHIVLRSGRQYLSAGGARYDFDSETLRITGDVEYRDPATRILGREARFSRETGLAHIEGAEFQLWSAPARGSAEVIDIFGDGRLKLRDVTYTACPPGKRDWLIRADRLEVDEESGYATARGARFEVKGLPLMYLPYFTYPVSNRRKTGFLIPDLGTSSSRGVDLSIPWYWNIAPNYDATLKPRLMTRRGLQMGAEFRYLLSGGHEGRLNGEYLADDDQAHRDRSLLAITHQSALPRGWRARLNVTSVSDDEYLEDFGSGFASTSLTHLPRRLDLEFFNGAWDAALRIEDYQTIDSSLLPAEKPYARMPQFTVHGYFPDSALGLSWEILADLGYFDRKVGVRGFRAHLMPTLSLPVDWKFFEFTPSVSLAHTRYDLNRLPADKPRNPTRTAPIFSADLSTSFERASSGSRWITTLEPRVLYTYIPFRRQDDLPVFDTIDPDLNIIQLFRKNRFVGYDRLADTNQVALGLTARMINAQTGGEFLRLTMGQLRYLSKQDVTLPGEPPNDSNSSDYIAEFNGRFAGRWRTNATLQWNSDSSETRRAELGIRYQRDPRRVASLGYRFRRDSFEDLNAALAWPIGGRWNFVGRFSYSLESSTALEQFVALEYETCCWAIRANWRRYVTRRSGDSDSSVGVQFILKGLSDPGTAAEELLGYGNLRY